MKKFLFLFVILQLTIVNCQLSFSQFSIIPQPVEINFSKAHNVIIDSTFTIEYYSFDLAEEAEMLQDYFVKFHALHLKTELIFRDNPDEEDGFEEVSGNNRIILENQSNEIADTIGFYKLNVLPGTVQILGKEQGIFYGIQTLMQMTFFSLNLQSSTITDYPRFSWRGMHLDVSRHFFDTDFIKKYIDLLAMYKMNVFHWHLTDDQGWRIEIKKYPKLTEIGAWRNGSMIGHYNEQEFDTIRYGGYYTQEEIKEVVAYAQARHITIVPEIEMPGHALAALSAYPEYSCTGGPFEVGKAWGVYDDVYCAGNDSTFIFLQNILDEVVDLFPGEYIHIGGDECPKTRWAKCEKCQKRMKNEGLSNEHELQSYFIQRIEKYLNGKKKKIIGWDEILEGGLAPNAAVMSWRGTEGGIAAAKEKHFVVMTPGSHCYFDHYQGNPRFEPLAIGGNTTLEKVYSYEPIPKGLTEEESKYILGAQGNVWTEYMAGESHVEYMVLPRMLALSEVLWCKKEMKNKKLFMEKMSIHYNQLEKLNLSYSKSFFQLKYKIIPDLTGHMKIVFENEFNLPILKCTGFHEGLSSIRNCDEFHDTIRNNTYFLKKLSSGISFRYAHPLSEPIYISFYPSKSTAKKIYYSSSPSKQYNLDENFKLLDGVIATFPRISSEWLAWEGEDLEMKIDLEKIEKISRIKIYTLLEENSWIYVPSEIKIELSKNGIDYKELIYRTSEWKEESFQNRISFLSEFRRQKTRYVKITLKNPGIIPEGQPGAGNPSWMFFDEITID